MKIKTIFLFLIFTLPIAGCDWAEEKIAQHKAEKARKRQEAVEQTRQERLAWAEKHPIVGNLGGVPVSLPEFVVENVQYDDTLGPFSKEWKTYQIPEKRTYTDNLMAFGFVFDFKTNELRKHFVNYDRWAKDFSSKTSTWVRVGVFSGKSGPKEDMNQWAKVWLPENGYYRRYKYSKTAEEFGLEKYQVPDILDEKTQKPIRHTNDYGDTFLSRDSDGNITTVIKCSNYNKYEVLICKCYLQVPDLNTRLTLTFYRHHLEHWQSIQQLAEQHLRSWIVNPEHISNAQ